MYIHILVIKMELQEMGVWGGGMDWIEVAQMTDRWLELLIAVIKLWVR